MPDPLSLRRRAPGLFFAAILAALVCAGQTLPAVSAQSAEPSATPTALNLTINGQITSGTAGVTVSPGLSVTLHVMRPAESAAAAGSGPFDVTRYQAVSGAAGEFRFENIPARTGDLIVASVAFEGIPQSSALISLGPSPEEFSLPVTVYGTTRDSNVIRTISATHTLDVLPGALQVLSAYEMRNASDRLYVSADRTPDGQPVSLRFPLPIGAVGVAFDQPDAFHVGGEAIAPVVEDVRPVRPGEAHEVVFSYQIPYTDGAVFDQDYLYRAEAVEMLIPDDAGLRLVGGAPIVSRAPETPRTAAFTSSADTSLNPARPFTRYRLEGSLQPGDRLVFSLEGGLAPTPTPGPATGGFSTGANIFSLIVLAIALVSAVLIGALVIRRMPGGRRP